MGHARTPRVADCVVYRMGSREYDALPRGSSEARVHAAIITRVYTPECVNLHVFFDAADNFVRTSVSHEPELAEGVENTSGNSHWLWPDEVETDMLPNPQPQIVEPYDPTKPPTTTTAIQRETGGPYLPAHNASLTDAPTQAMGGPAPSPLQTPPTAALPSPNTPPETSQTPFVAPQSASGTSTPTASQASPAANEAPANPTVPTASPAPPPPGATITS
jgi:hypothetical protein